MDLMIKGTEMTEVLVEIILERKEEVAFIENRVCGIWG